MDNKIEELGKDLIWVFRKHGIEIVEGSLELKTKPLYRNDDRAIVQPLEITLDRFYSHAKRRIDGTYDDIYVDRL